MWGLANRKCYSTYAWSSKLYSFLENECKQYVWISQWQKPNLASTYLLPYLFNWGVIDSIVSERACLLAVCTYVYLFGSNRSSVIFAHVYENMKVLALIFLSVFLHLSYGYVFTEKPEETTWGIQGEPLQLQCAVDESWQVFFVIYAILWLIFAHLWWLYLKKITFENFNALLGSR